MSIENDSSRMAVTENVDSSGMPLSEHMNELRSKATRGITGIVCVVLLTYLLWPLCTRFLELIYPANRVDANVAQFRGSHLSGSIDLGTYWGLPFLGVAILIFALPGLYRRERRLAIPLFCLAVILYYAVPPLAIWVISTRLFPVIRTVLSGIGITAVATTAEVNSIFVVIVFVLAFPVVIFGTRALANYFEQSTRGAGRIFVGVAAAGVIAAILPIWLFLAIIVYMPVAVFITLRLIRDLTRIGRLLNRL